MAQSFIFHGFIRGLIGKNGNAGGQGASSPAPGEDLTNEEQKAAKEQIFNSKEVEGCVPWKVPSI